IKPNPLFFLPIIFFLFSSGFGQNTCLKTFQNVYKNADNNVALDVVSTQDGMIYIAGNSVLKSTGYSDIFITKQGLDGKILWSKTYGSSRNETIRRVKLTKDGGLVVIGQTNSFNDLNGDVLCFKIDASGNLIWSKKFGIGSTYGD